MIRVTKTCMQHGRDRLARPVLRRRPHLVPSATASGFARCSACGANIYVGFVDMDEDRACAARS